MAKQVLDKKDAAKVYTSIVLAARGSKIYKPKYDNPDEISRLVILGGMNIVIKLITSSSNTKNNATANETMTMLDIALSYYVPGCAK